MAGINILLPQGSNKARSTEAGAQQLMNAYAEPLGEGGKDRIAIYAAPGLKPWVTLPKGPWRGAIVVQDTIYVVSGPTLYTVSQSGSVRVIGAIPGDGFVSMDVNALGVPDIVIVASGVVLVCKSGVVSTLNQPSLPPPVDVTFIRGRFVFPISDGRFFYTQINSLEVRALNFYNAEGNPDGLVASWSRRNELWLVGTRTVEIWTPTQDALDPFTIMGGGALPYGSLSGPSITETSDNIFWIDHESNVRMAGNGQPKQIDTPFVSRVIDAEPNQGDIRGVGYSIAGVNYYEISGSTFTLRYSLATGEWTERATRSLNRWRGQGAVLFGSRVIMGDHVSGQLYTLEPDYTMDGDEPIIMRVVLPILHAFPKPLTLYSIHMDAVTGVGGNTGNSVIDDPVAMLRLSEDGGKSWFGPIMERLGRSGEQRRVVWRQLGTYERQGVVVEISISAGVARCILSAVANGEAGTS